MSRTKPKPNRFTATAQLPLPWWRWWVYLASTILVFSMVFVGVGGTWPVNVLSLNAWKDASRGGEFIVITGVLGGLIMALLKLFLDPVFLGIAQRRSKLELVGDLATSVALTAVGVAAEGLLNAAASANGSSNDESGGGSGGGVSSGGGGNFGGGGASGNF